MEHFLGKRSDFRGGRSAYFYEKKKKILRLTFKKIKEHALRTMTVLNPQLPLQEKQCLKVVQYLGS